MTKAPIFQKWSLLIIISSLSVVILMAVEGAGVVRSLVSIWFLFLCPGLAFVQLLRIGPTWVEIILAVAFSLALDGLVAGILVYAQQWSPHVALAILVSWSLLGVFLVQIGVDFSKPN